MSDWAEVASHKRPGILPQGQECASRVQVRVLGRGTTSSSGVVFKGNSRWSVRVSFSDRSATIDPRGATFRHDTLEIALGDVVPM
ncbi:hypothetical protein K0M31_019425 [Melipona bicolor]|uniref:Uncharacterized protein n=1 Tax=Melipona bicolor TaxID=60889 RepID=A0AA40G399_9HYME|nr:hypothetical protein K0M31_019425 [Melipona bicolor]